jgi:hypothetical protein
MLLTLICLVFSQDARIEILDKSIKHAYFVSENNLQIEISDFSRTLADLEKKKGIQKNQTMSFVKNKLREARKALYLRNFDLTPAISASQVSINACGELVDTITVFQIVGPSEFLGKVVIDGKPKIIKFRGWSTKKFTDGDAVELTGLGICLKNETYGTLGGSKTVFVFESIDAKTVAERLEKFETNRTDKPSARTWKDRENAEIGTFLLVDFDGKKATLQNEKERAEFPISKFCVDDQKHIRNAMGDHYK